MNTPARSDAASITAVATTAAIPTLTQDELARSEVVTTAVAPPIQALADLFTSTLAAVKFPDVDAAVLAGATGEVRSLALTVARAEAALEAARAALEVGQESLLGKAQRALSYARIFAEDDDALSSRLDQIILNRAARRAPRETTSALNHDPAHESGTLAPRRRTRARQAKNEQPPAPLFSVPPESHAEAPAASHSLTNEAPTHL